MLGPLARALERLVTGLGRLAERALLGVGFVVLFAGFGQLWYFGLEKVAIVAGAAIVLSMAWWYGART